MTSFRNSLSDLIVSARHDGLDDAAIARALVIETVILADQHEMTAIKLLKGIAGIIEAMAGVLRDVDFDVRFLDTIPDALRGGVHRHVAH